MPILKSIYNSIDEVELYIFGYLENRTPNAVVGPTLASVIAQTFYQLKFSDRFWHSFETSGLTLGTSERHWSGG